LVVIEPPHHRPPPQRIASEQRNHCSRKASTTFATKSAHRVVSPRRSNLVAFGGFCCKTILPVRAC